MSYQRGYQRNQLVIKFVPGRFKNSKLKSRKGRRKNRAIERNVKFQGKRMKVYVRASVRNWSDRGSAYFFSSLLFFPLSFFSHIVRACTDAARLVPCNPKIYPPRVIFLISQCTHTHIRWRGPVALRSYLNDRVRVNKSLSYSGPIGRYTTSQKCHCRSSLLCSLDDEYPHVFFLRIKSRRSKDSHFDFHFKETLWKITSS